MLKLFNFLGRDEVNPRNYLFPLRQKYLTVVPTGLAGPDGRRPRTPGPTISRRLGRYIDFPLADCGNGPHDLSGHMLFRQDPDRAGRQAVGQVFSFLIHDHDQDLYVRVL